jgi:two-component system, NtrC family, response regulator HydG
MLPTWTRLFQPPEMRRPPPRRAARIPHSSIPLRPPFWGTIAEALPLGMKILDPSQTLESEERLVTEKTFPRKPARCELPPTPLPGREASQPLEREGCDRHSFDRIIGRSPAMRRIYRIIERVAPTNATVLISGRTGTGKEIVARSIHCNSARASRPFVDVNCSALPEQLIESELFGYQKGSFTGATQTRKGLFETAHGGTLFLDEVQALKPELQAKLLRVLQERVIRQVGGRENKEIDVRVIAATNQDIVEAVRKREFREVLYYRLNVINIRLPELRERREDIPLLIEHFLKLHAETNHQEARHFSNEAMRLLLSSEWPGNVRELENAVEHALAIGTGPTLRIPDLPPHINGFVVETGAPESVGEARTLREVERRHILRVLEESGGNHAHAAKVLGIDRRTLYRKLNKYKL